MMENYSLSDIRAATEGNSGGFGGFGGGYEFLLIIVLFMFLAGAGGLGGGFGGFGGGAGGNLTRAEMQLGFDAAEVTRKLDGITNGLSDGFYAQNTTMLNGFAGVTSAVREAQFAAKDCCCETNRNIDGVRYDAQKNTCDIITAIHEDGEKTRAMIQSNEIQALRDKVSDLQMAQSQCSQNAYLLNAIRPYPIPAYQVGNPYAWTSQCGCGCGCGYGAA